MTQMKGLAKFVPFLLYIKKNVVYVYLKKSYLPQHYYTMILQHIRILVGDSGSEPGSTVYCLSTVWRATNKCNCTDETE